MLVKILIELAITLVPLLYGAKLLFDAYKIKGYESEEEKEIVNKRIDRMRKSGSLFLFAGLYMAYQFYKNHF